MLTETNKINIELWRKIANQGKFVRLEPALICRPPAQVQIQEHMDLSALFPGVFEFGISDSQSKCLPLVSLDPV